MLTAQAEDLMKLIKQRRELRENRDRILGYKTRLDELGDLKKRTKPLIQTCLAFRESGIGDFDEPVYLKNLIDITIELKGLFEENPEKIIEARSLFQLTQGFTGLCGLLDSKLRTEWENYVMENNPAAKSELLYVLGRLPTFAATVSKIKRLSEQIMSMKQHLPKDKEDIKDFEKKVEELKLAWQKIGSDEVPKGVLQFLQGAVSGGAHLNLLTDEVRQWLALNGLSNSFRINLRTDTGE